MSIPGDDLRSGSGHRDKGETERQREERFRAAREDELAREVIVAAGVHAPGRPLSFLEELMLSVYGSRMRRARNSWVA